MIVPVSGNLIKHGIPRVCAAKIECKTNRNGKVCFGNVADGMRLFPTNVGPE